MSTDRALAIIMKFDRRGEKFTLRKVVKKRSRETFRINCENDLVQLHLWHLPKDSKHK